ncbi:hypothetical protein FSARC_502 [Fusarium sarcochroum]|uniref:NAD(P)-binding domain-containing protein n=1 Tax=Fusarium sarcochroum TaxID=1208366 RepID=A0A8H4XFG2_9HYPO|nr:hypothetical protein FSARC_502 [Fusarium sarcochroum]
MQITIAPASMKTSAAAIRSLLLQDKSVRIKALYRDLKKVPDEFNSVDNLIAVQGDVCDAYTLDFSGSDAVLACLPPAYDGRDIIAHAETVANNIRDAVEKSGSVKRLVLLSSMGAEFAEGVGEIKTNHISEELLRSADIPEIIFARCAYFMENWTISVESLKGPEPFFFSTITPLDFRCAMVAAQDIGHSLANELTREWSPPIKPYIYELHGPQPYSPLDVQKAFSQALDKHIEVKAVERYQLPKFFGQMFAPQIVKDWVEMTLCFLPGGIAEKDPDKLSDDVAVVNGKTTLDEAIEAATVGLK